MNLKGGFWSHEGILKNIQEFRKSLESEIFYIQTKVENKEQPLLLRIYIHDRKLVQRYYYLKRCE